MPSSQPPLYLSVETDWVSVVGLWSKPMYGMLVAITAGRPWLHARVGVGAVAGESMRFGRGARVAPVLESADFRMCVAGHRGLGRVRLCGGMLAGTMRLRWTGDAPRGRRKLPFLATVFGGDYSIALGRVVDIHGSVALNVPVVGTQIDGVDADGRRLRLRTQRVAAMFGLGLGLRLH